MSESVVVTVRFPDVPVIVSVAGPVVALLLAFKVSTLDPDVGFVPHDAVTPLGNPETERFALPVNPYCGVIVIVDADEVPWPKFT
jgi:hypothetical protein